jgi:hypothetical protein
VPFTLSSWHHLLVSADVTRNPPVLTAYLDDHKVSQVPQVMDGLFTSTSIIPFNGLSFFALGDPFDNNFTGDVADFWVAPGQSLLDANGDIPTSTRRAFISADGKPVDLGSNCSAPTGTTPAVCFSGDASTFANNKGTGGSFGVYTMAGHVAGRNGAGPISVPGAMVGTPVVEVSDSNTGDILTSDFESTVSIPNQVQQTSSSDLSGALVNFLLRQGTLTDASTSPSN